MWDAGQPQARSVFRRDLVNWFRMLPQGTIRYQVFFLVRLANGYVAGAVPRRSVSAPLRQSQLDAILAELELLVKRYEERDDETERPDRFEMHVWHSLIALSGVTLVDESLASGGGGNARGGAGGSARRGGGAGGGAGGSAGSSRDHAPRSKYNGTRKVHHRSGSGRNAHLLTSLQRCVAIAKCPGVQGKDNPKQRELALQLAERFDLEGEEAIAEAEAAANVRINVYDTLGEKVRSSEGDDAPLVNVMYVGDDVYRYIFKLEDVARLDQTCKHCGRWQTNLRSHEKSMACRKCERCKAKFATCAEMEHHLQTCDAHDEHKHLKPTFIKGPNEEWFVWDIESIRGEATCGGRRRWDTTK